MSQFNDEILEGDGMSLKGISSNSSVPKKKGTIRNIKPPGVYVNGKATSKSERSLMDKTPSSSSFSDAPPPPPVVHKPSIKTSNSDSNQYGNHNESLKMDPEQFKEFEEIISNGSSQEFRAYSDYSINIREQLEMEFNDVLAMLEQSSSEVNKLTDQSIKNTNHKNVIQDDDASLLSLVEDRNLEVENQLTSVWDELMIKDEIEKQLTASLDKVNKELIASQKKATQQITQNNAKLDM